jgi:hypothetical protein
MLPNFIIVGAPKAGTTSLYHYLTKHPQVFMSDPKEVNYFSCEEIEAQGLYYKDFKIKNREDYEKLFHDAQGKKAIGEASVSYLFYPKTPQKIKDMLPDVKIIILLRDPVSRGFSHYLMDYRLGLVDLPYGEIVHKTSRHKNLYLYHQQYVELGLYYEQVKRYLELFGPEQVKIHLQEDLHEDTEGVILDLYDFLEIDKSFMPNVGREHNAFLMPKNRLIHKLYASYPVRSMVSVLFPDVVKEKVKYILFKRKQKPKLDVKLKNELLEICKPDIQKLEVLIQKDLKQWYRTEA